MPYVHGFHEDTEHQPLGAHTNNSDFDGWSFTLERNVTYLCEATFTSDVEQSICIEQTTDGDGFNDELKSYPDQPGPVKPTSSIEIEFLEDNIFVFAQHKNTPPDGGQPWYPTPRAPGGGNPDNPDGNFVLLTFDDNGRTAQVLIRPKPKTRKPKPRPKKPKPGTKKPKPTTKRPKPSTKKPKLGTKKPRPRTKKPRR